jgi:hypothetical protein
MEVRVIDERAWQFKIGRMKHSSLYQEGTDMCSSCQPGACMEVHFSHERAWHFMIGRGVHGSPCRIRACMAVHDR